MATIYDIAKIAGVAPKTVARALNGEGPVKSETRDKIEKAAAALGYVPSQAARAMRSNRSGLVGLVTGAISTTPQDAGSAGLPDIHIVQGIQMALADAGVTLLISDIAGREDRTPALFRTLLEHRVEGLFYVAPHHQVVELPEFLGEAPIVLVNCFDRRGTPSIVPDDESGQRDLVARLIAFGHRRIGYLTLPEDMVAHRLRLNGYRRALRDAGLQFDPDLVQLGDAGGKYYETTLLASAIDRLLALDDPPTVLCCGNDRLALKVYGLLRMRGLRLPEDIGVAGYDDHRAISELLVPPLTTAELPYRAIGARAAERLLALMRNQQSATASVPEKVGGAIKWRQSVRSLDAKVKAMKGARSKELKA